MDAQLFVTSLLLLLAGGVGALLLGRRPALVSWWAAGCTLAASLCGLAVAFGVLRGDAPLALRFPWAVPGGEGALLVDPLAALFLVPVYLLALLCSLYGVGYLAPAGRRRALGPHWLFFCGLVLAMVLVLTAAHALFFLAVWELMAVTSFLLVAFDQREAEVGRAAWLYLLACQLGGVCVLALVLLAGQACGSLRFADFAGLGTASPGFATLLFLLGLFGFGAKAGLFPLHVWLPDAHPAAPSHVSALMSGVMVKTGIYGLLRLLTWLPAPPAWWGLLLAALGILGALYGIAQAAVQQDLKRCLAYSTVENVGIILLGLGMGLFWVATGQPLLALLGFAGGLLHVWNHALFKGLMFLGAGSLLHGSGTRDLSRMGGLLRRMPLTGTLLLTGSLAIAALPPLNGLASEWLIYLGLLRSGLLGSGLASLLPLLLAALLALTGALAIVVFTRIAGVALLGEPRCAETAGAHEAGAALLVPMVVLAVGCLAIGLAPQAAASLLALPLAALSGLTPATTLGGLAPLAALGRLELYLLGPVLVLALVLIQLVKTRPVAAAGTWGCGFAFPTARMAYTAEAYAELTRHQILPSWLRAGAQPPVLKGLFPGTGSFSLVTQDVILDRCLRPLFAALAERAVRLRWLQQGRLQIYLLYILLTCLLLIAWSVLAEQGGGIT